MMKIFTLLSLVCSGLSLKAQQSQDVYQGATSTGNVITTIDSIQFNAAGDAMQIVLLNGQVVTYGLNTVDSVKFSSGQSQGGSAHSCGAANVHNPNLTYGSMTDQEGNTYKTIVIGTQEWMAENLNTSIYRNGDAIPTGLSNTEWENTINTQQGAWAYYNNDASYACPYGKLYNWYACVDARGLCPTGWHVPSDDEWNVLVKYLDPNADTTCASCYQSTIAGAMLKSAGTIEGGDGYWYANDPSDEGTNSSGFSGLPGGYRFYNGDYDDVGNYGGWWSSTQNDSDNAWYRTLYYDVANVGRFYTVTQHGWGVRCLRD